MFRVAAGREEADIAFRTMSGEVGLPVLVQRHVAGEECNSAASGDGTGALLGEVMMKKRATTDGKAWAGISIHDEALAENARRLVAALKWKGPIEIEVMRDNQGILPLIKINPRFPAWCPLRRASGATCPPCCCRLPWTKHRLRWRRHGPACCSYATHRRPSCRCRRWSLDGGRPLATGKREAMTERKPWVKPVLTPIVPAG